MRQSTSGTKHVIQVLISAFLLICSQQVAAFQAELMDARPAFPQPCANSQDFWRDFRSPSGTAMFSEVRELRVLSAEELTFSVTAASKRCAADEGGTYAWANVGFFELWTVNRTAPGHRGLISKEPFGEKQVLVQAPAIIEPIDSMQLPENTREWQLTFAPLVNLKRALTDEQQATLGRGEPVELALQLRLQGKARYRHEDGREFSKSGATNPYVVRIRLTP